MAVSRPALRPTTHETFSARSLHACKCAVLRQATIHSAPRSIAWRLRASYNPEAYSDDEEESRTSNIDFVYMSAEQQAEMDREREEARQISLKEYEELKSLLLNRTWRFGTLFAGYLLFVISTEAAFLELLGAATSYGYFLWLIKDVDAYNEESEVPLRAAEYMEPESMRKFAKIGAAYQQAINPRLLIPVGLVAGCAAWNASFPDMQISLVDEGCLLGGFLSYKVALILKIYDDLKPRAMTEEEMLQASRPQLADLDDVPFDFGTLGRKKENEADGDGDGKASEENERSEVQD